MAYIYKILNKENGKFYIGSTNNFEKRRRKHIWELNNNCHKNKKLQNAWNKYRPNSFDFIILEEVPDNLQFLVEQRYLDKLKPFGDNGYNIALSTLHPFGKAIIKNCKECGDLFLIEYRGQQFCSETCENEYENSMWKRSKYEYKHIIDWTVDDHIAAWFDERWDK